MLRRALYCFGKSSVCPWRWGIVITEVGNGILRKYLLAQGVSFVDPNITDLLQGEHTRNFGRKKGWGRLFHIYILLLRSEWLHRMFNFMLLSQQALGLSEVRTLKQITTEGSLGAGKTRRIALHGFLATATALVYCTVSSCSCMMG